MALVQTFKQEITPTAPILFMSECGLLLLACGLKFFGKNSLSWWILAVLLLADLCVGVYCYDHMNDTKVYSDPRPGMV